MIKAKIKDGFKETKIIETQNLPDRMHIKVFPSGFTLVTEEMEAVKSIAVGFWVKAGAVNENQKYSGISHFTEHMLFKGTEKRTSADIARDMERIGAQVNAFTGKEATCYFFKTTAGHFEEAAHILLDMFTGSLFAKEELDRERQVIREEIRMSRDTPDELAHEEAVSLVLQGKPIGHSVTGDFTTLRRISSPVMHAYVKKFYQPERIVISVAGGIAAERVIAFFERFLEEAVYQKRSRSRMQIKAQASDMETEGGVASEKEADNNSEKEMEKNASSASASTAGGIAVQSGRYKSIVKKIEQAHISLACPGISLIDERYYAFSILNNALGGGMSSRLFQNIRERKGLAYSVFSLMGSFSSDGYLAIYAGVNRDGIARAVAGILEELKKIKTDGITQEEIDSSREQLKSAYVFGQESSYGKMIQNGKSLLLLHHIYTQDEVLSGYDRVTGEDIDRIRFSITDPAAYSGVVVGPSRSGLQAMLRGRL